MAGVTENLRKKTQASSYSIQVDSDRKATEIKLFAISSSPHMRAFHLAWLSLFACFFSTFSVPPLLPLIQKDLDLTASDVGRAGIAAFIGSIFSRLAMGPACDLVGPRIASATLSIITTPAVVYMCFIRSPVEFIIVRFLIGLSIANFVANQFWMSCMFSSCVVGLANGLAAGWANVGSGVTQLVMPVIYSLLMTRLRMPSSVAWRTAFVIPAVFQAVTAVMVLVFGQDLPDGNYATARKFSNTQQQRNRNGFNVLLKGLANYRGWILGLTYGFCFGVELTTDNVIARYFYDRFNLSIETSGAIASSFGLANIVSRPTGGYVSDRVGKRFGMRGRLWSLWVVQTVAGLLCVLLGRVNYSLWASMVVMCVFSFFVQAASGLTFGVVPFVSKRSMGVISGMTGSGGTVGAVVTQLLLFSGTKKMPTETSISLMGIMMLVCSLPITLIYFPQWGGMFCRPSSFHTPATDDDDEDYQLLNQNSL